MTNRNAREGWNNYETWTASRWLEQDSEQNAYWLTAAEDAMEEAEFEGERIGLTQFEQARYLLAMWLKRKLQEFCPLREPGLYRDLLRHALDQVHYREIAEKWLVSIKAYRELP